LSLFAGSRKSPAAELVAKSEDQLSSPEPDRRRRNHTAPPTAASAAATALLFGTCESPEPVAGFAFCFATRFVAVHTTQPRTAFAAEETGVGLVRSLRACG